MIETHQIIVMGATKYSEEKLIVNALSRSAGRITMLVNITHSQRAAVRHTLFQPLALLEVQWEASSRTKMYKPKSARMTTPLMSLFTDPIKASVAMFLAEFLNNATRNDFDGGLLFDYIVYALQWYDTAERDYANFHLVFLLRLSRFLGIAPNLDEPQGYFDLQNGEFSATKPTHIYYIKGAEANVLPTLWRMNFGTMQLFRLSGQQRSQILEAIITYYRLHLPGIANLKSLDVLKSVFR